MADYLLRDNRLEEVPISARETQNAALYRGFSCIQEDASGDKHDRLLSYILLHAGKIWG